MITTYCLVIKVTENQMGQHITELSTFNLQPQSNLESANVLKFFKIMNM